MQVTAHNAGVRSVRRRTRLLWSAAALVLAACATTSAPTLSPEQQLFARIAALEAGPAAKPSTVVTDFPALVAALPQEVVKVTWADLSTAPDGATVIDDLSFSIVGLEGARLIADEVRTWDFDTAFLLARVQGERLDEQRPLLRRAEITGLRTEGFADAVNSISRQATDAVVGAMTGALAPDAAEEAAQAARDSEVVYETYDVSIDRIVIDSVGLRPFEAAAPGEGPLAGLQGYMAGFRSVEVGQALQRGMRAELSFKGVGASLGATVGVDRYYVEGISGGDTAGLRLDGMDITLTGMFPKPEATGKSEQGSPRELEVPFDVEIGVDAFAWEGLRLDNLYRSLAEGQWPSTRKADLFSLGKLTTAGERLAINGETLITTARTETDLSGWFSFLPTRIIHRTEDQVYSLSGAMNLFDGLVTAGVLPDEDGSRLKVLRQVRDLLAANGTDTLTLDGGFTWEAEPIDGASGLGLNFTLDKGLSFDFALEAIMPSAKAVLAALTDDIAADGSNTTGALVARDFKLVRASLVQTDTGGIDRWLGALIAVAKGLEEPGPLAFFRTQTPQSLRQMGAGFMGMAATQVPPEGPLADIVGGFVKFVGTGGQLAIVMQPERPLGTPEFDMLASDPGDELEVLGLSATYTAPADLTR
jgi:hypothetical protein